MKSVVGLSVDYLGNGLIYLATLNDSAFQNTTHNHQQVDFDHHDIRTRRSRGAPTNWLSALQNCLVALISDFT